MSEYSTDWRDYCGNEACRRLLDKDGKCANAKAKRGAHE